MTEITPMYLSRLHFALGRDEIELKRKGGYRPYDRKTLQAFFGSPDLEVVIDEAAQTLNVDRAHLITEVERRLDTLVRQTVERWRATQS